MRKFNGMMYVKHKRTKPIKKLTCHKCSKELTPDIAYYYVDGCNCAITDSAPPYCRECYKIVYGR